MPQFEDYKKAVETNKKDQFIASESTFGNLMGDNLLEKYDLTSFDYDPDQLKEHFDLRFSDTEAFNMRTKYYFSDSDVATAKVNKYYSLYGNSRDNRKDELAQYAKKYTYRSAKKRKYRANDARNIFSAMWGKMRDYEIAKNNAKRAHEGGKLDDLKDYQFKEEIMKLRLEGMTNAAKVKAQSKKHEDYLVARAKLSCNLVLKEQLDNILKKDGLDQRTRKKLNSKLNSVNEEIRDAIKSVAANVPKAEEVWRRKNGINEQKYRDNLALFKDRNDVLKCDYNSAMILTNLEYIENDTENCKWPMKIVFTDSNSSPISKAEKENMDHNNNYASLLQKKETALDEENNAEADRIQAVLDKYEQDALNRFMKMKIPSAETLKGAGVRKYIMGNLRDYYDLTKRALPFYQEQLKNEDSFVSRYAQNHQGFRESLESRIAYLAAVDKYIDFKLRNRYRIQYHEKKFKFETDQKYWYKKDNGKIVSPAEKFGYSYRGTKGTNTIDDKFRELSDAYNRYNNNQNNFDPIGPVLPKDLMYEEQEQEQEHHVQEEGQEQLVEEANPVVEEANPVVEVVAKNEDADVENEEEKQEEKAEIPAKEDAEEEVKKEEEEKKEEEKLEEKKEEVKQEEKEEQNPSEEVIVIRNILDLFDSKEDKNKNEEKKDSLSRINEYSRTDNIKIPLSGSFSSDFVLNRVKTEKDIQNEKDEIERIVELKKIIKTEKDFKKQDLLQKELDDHLKGVFLKKDFATKINEKVNAATERKISLRRSIDIKYKKKLSFKTFDKLSGFGAYLDKNGLSDLCDKYGRADQIEDKEKRDQAVFGVIDSLTDKIMKLDLRGLNLSDDNELMENATKLEQMSDALRSYTRLISQKDNIGYLDYLEKKEGENRINDGVNVYSHEQVLERVEKLSAVANYYRLRKIVLTDEIYKNTKDAEITLGIGDKPTDGIQTKRLKRMMRASMMAFENLQKVFYGNTTKNKKSLDKAVTEMEANDINHLLVDYGKYTAEQEANENVLESENMYKIRAIDAADEYVRDLEREREFQAPYWYNNILSLDPKKIPKAVNNGFYGMNAPQDDVNMIKATILGNSRAVELDKKRVLAMREMLGPNKTIKEEKDFKEFGDGRLGVAVPKFEGGKDKLLGSMIISDDWTRLRGAFACFNSAYKTDEELVEMTELLTIQSSKEWIDDKGEKHSKNWADIAKDPEALAFYESAYKEMAMKYMYTQYASAKRIAETVSVKFLMLHYADLICQMNKELHYAMVCCGTLSNFMDHKGTYLTNNVENLFKNDTDKEYKFDINDALIVCGLTSNLNFRFMPGLIIKNALGGTYGTMGYDVAGDVCKALFGKKNYYKGVVLPAYKKEVESTLHVDHVSNGKKYYKEQYFGDGMYEVGKTEDIIAWYLDNHKGVIKRDALNKTITEYGETFAPIQHDDSMHRLNVINENGEELYMAINQERVDIPTNKEIEAYGKHLKSNGYYSARNNLPDPDLYRYEGAVGDIDPNTEYTSQTNNKGVKKTITGSMRIKNRENDPYFLNFYKNKCKELEVNYTVRGEKGEDIKKTAVAKNPTVVL